MKKILSLIFVLIAFNAAAETDHRTVLNNEVIIECAAFVETNYETNEMQRLKTCGRCAGIDGNLPDTFIDKITIKNGSGTFLIPDDLTKDIYNLHIGPNYISDTFSVKAKGDIVTIALSGGDGAGGYDVIFEVDLAKKAVIRKIYQFPDRETPEISTAKLSMKADEKVKTIQPSIGPKPDFSNESKEAFKRRGQLLARYSQLNSKEEKELFEILKRYPETIESIWDVEGGGCSWYCGGGPYKIESSSDLSPSKVSDYDAANAHDFTFKTAWVEGVKGYGEGESISYYFKNDSPRIHTIKIYNGYIKSPKAWKENSRVKSLLLMENDKPIARLRLQDTSALQSFGTELLGRRKDGNDLVLKFVIEEVYPGTKYSDTAITGIYFDGTDVH